MQKLTVVVPCYNEEANLLRFPTEVFMPLASMVPEFEIVFVNDGSSDRTGPAIEQMKQKFPFVKTAHHAGNQGLGQALHTGFAQATGEAIVTLDSDLTFSPKEIPLLIRAFAPDVDCVMGSPLTGKMEKVQPIRRLLSWGVNRIYGILLGQPLSSVSSIFRLYRTSKLKTLELHCRSFDVNAEILFKLLQSHARVVEVPVTLGRRIHGVSKINVGREIKNHLKMFSQIIQWKIKN